MAGGKKNAIAKQAWIIFEDESGLSLLPVIRRTWAPRGQTPKLTHRFNWKRLSMAAAIAYRYDGQHARILFQTCPGAYDSQHLIAFLRQLRRHFRGQRVILLWDGLPAHRSRQMTDFLTAQAHWLEVVRLPAYAPELNPAEGLWAYLKNGELANLCCQTIEELEIAAEDGVDTVRRDSQLAFSFLHHAGLSF